MNRSMVSWFGGPTKYSDVMRWHLVSMLKGKERRDNIHITTVYSHYLVCLSSFPRKIICACLGKKWKKDCPTIQEICWCLLTQNQKHSTACFPPMIWYDMIAFLMFLCRFAVSVAGKCTRDDSIQLEISPVAATTLMMKNWSPNTIFLTHFKLWPPIIQIIQGPKGPKVGMPQKSHTSPGRSPSSPDFPVVARTLLGQSQGDCHLFAGAESGRSFIFRCEIMPFYTKPPKSSNIH